MRCIVLLWYFITLGCTVSVAQILMRPTYHGISWLCAERTAAIPNNYLCGAFGMI